MPAYRLLFVELSDVRFMPVQRQAAIEVEVGARRVRPFLLVRRIVTLHVENSPIPPRNGNILEGMNGKDIFWHDDGPLLFRSLLAAVKRFRWRLVSGQ